MSDNGDTAIPSRFQLGDRVRVGKTRGSVVAVTFALAYVQNPFEPDSTVYGGKIFYDVLADNSSVLNRVPSDAVIDALEAVT